jgi:hypothetical protein
MNFKKFTFVVTLVSLFSIHNAFAAGDLYSCPGVAHSVTWSSGNSPTSCTITVDDGSLGCRVSSAAVSGGPVGVTAPTDGGVCNAGISCTNTGGTTGDSSRLISYSGAAIHTNNCCNVGKYAGKPTWNLSLATCVSTTGRITAPVCTIQPGDNNCVINASWSTSGAIGLVTLKNDSNQDLGTGPSGNASPSYSPPGAYSLRLFDDTTLLDQANFNINCAAGSSWHPTDTVCLTNVSIGNTSADFNVTPSTIYAGGTSTISWNSVAGGGTVVCNITNNVDGTSISANPAGGSHLVSPVVDTTYTLTCSNGASTDTKSDAVIVKSGTLNLSASHCTILKNNSSCNVNASWTSANIPGGSLKFLDMNGGAPGVSAVFPTPIALSSGPTMVWVGYDHTTFNLTDGIKLLVQKIVTSDCENLTGWSYTDNKCVDIPVIVFTPTDQKTSYDKPFNFNWKATNVNGTNCDAVVPLSAVSPDWTSTLPLTGNVNTSLTSTQKFAMSCLGYNGNYLSGTTTITVCNSGTPALIGGSCVVGPTPAGYLTGLYTSNGTYKAICSDSKTYKVYRDAIEIDSGLTIPTSYWWKIYNIGASDGNYTTVCISAKTDDNYYFTATSSPLAFAHIAPDPIVRLDRTSPISKNASTLVSWEIMYPGSIQTPVRTCTLTAKPLCTANKCTAFQTSEGIRVNAIIAASSTDLTDPSTSRLISSPGANNSLNYIPKYDYVAKNGLNIDGVTPTDWKARGEKHFTLGTSMQFTVDCGAGPQASSTKTVMVSVGSNE